MVSAVATDTSVVRVAIWLVERLISSGSFMRLYFRRFSRMRSKTTTVSLIEYPASSNSAATEFNVKSKCKTENSPAVTSKSTLPVRSRIEVASMLRTSLAGTKPRALPTPRRPAQSAESRHLFEAHDRRDAQQGV